MHLTMRPRALFSLSGLNLRRTSLYATAAARRPLVTLAIETSCDDTAVAVLERRHPSQTTRLLFNERVSADLRAYRGVRPAAALESHQRTLAGLVQRAIARLPAADDDGHGHGHGRRPDFVAATRGPGIHSNLATGLFTAKGLALAWGVPLVGVHHMQAHALTPRLVRALGVPMAGEDSASASSPGTPTPEFPFLTFLVSGGHAQLVLSAGLTDHRVLATTTDAAIGNVLDQTARVVLPASVLAACPDVMYGRHLEAYAFPDPPPSDDSSSSSSSSNSDSSPYAFYKPPRSRADELADVDTGYTWRVPSPMRTTRRLAYSFSAIHSTVHAVAASRGDAMDDAERRALARHTQRAAFDHLASRLCLALDPAADYDGAALARAATTLVVAGGVACNKFLMHVLRTTLAARGLLSDSSSSGGIREIIAPPPALCTDNAAMIAWAGMEMYEAGWCSDLDVVPLPKWPLDPGVRLPEKSGGGPGGPGGLMEVGGWLRRE
ncbi:hypothetical protein NHJ13734_001599 [Beauveria thailandica]